jgi:membrane peptidoglycan carboxypeptidase
VKTNHRAAARTTPLTKSRRGVGYQIGRFLLRSAMGLGVVALIGVAVALGSGLLLYRYYADGLVPPDELGVNRPSGGAVILDRNGKVLYRYVDDKDGVRTPVLLTDISPTFLAATIATEDESFFINPGFNINGLARATLENFGHGREDGLQASGGSSITQQLVKNLYIDEGARSERSIDRKLREIVFSIELTKRYSKEQILHWYVNQISYGGVYTGVEAAARGYFDKPARGLTLGEAALLAGVPQSPAAYDPATNLEAALGRRNQVLDLLERKGTIQIGPDLFYTPTSEEIAAARDEFVTIRIAAFPIEAPHFVLSYLAPQLEQLVGKDALLHDGLVVTTTLDLDLNYRAQEHVQRLIAQNERVSQAHNGAVLVIQPATGEILAMVGSRDYYREDIDGTVNNLLALNSPGSTLKPFVYLTTFLNLGWSPGTTIEDTPVSFKEWDGMVFSPTNPGKNYQGTITVRNSLGNSLNVPAFKAAQAVGVSKVVDTARGAGLTQIDGAYGPAIAIGGIDIRALDLTYAYAVLANGGVMAGQDSFAPRTGAERSVEPISILKIESPRGVVFNVDDHRIAKRVFSAEHAYMVTDILSDPRAVCITFGCGGLSVPGYKVAMKTGTSEPYDPKGPLKGKIGETWAFGFTPDYVVGAWAGNSDNSPVVNIFSTTISFPIMRETMLSAYNGAPQRHFERPPGIVQKNVCAPARVDPNAPPLPPQPLVQLPQNPPPGFPLSLALQPPAPPPMVCTSDIAIAGSR